MTLRVLSAVQVQALLPMADCIEAMDRAMRATSGRQISCPPRLFTPLRDQSGLLGLMPGSLLEPAVYGAKVISLHADNPAQGRPAIQGFVTLFDHHTGTPLAIIAGGAITALRTAAASALATRELARPDAGSHGVLGTGVQGRTHIQAVAAVRDIGKVVIWGRDPAKVQGLLAEYADAAGCEFVAAATAAEAAACDVVSVVTGASEPVIFRDFVNPGAHVNLVGAHTPTTREADAALIASAAVYVDSYESAANEAGDLLLAAGEGRFSMSAIHAEIGEVLLGTRSGREQQEQITVYKSLGVVAQDLFAAELVYRRACETDSGALVEF